MSKLKPLIKAYLELVKNEAEMETKNPFQELIKSIAIIDSQTTEDTNLYNRLTDNLTCSPELINYFSSSQAAKTHINHLLCILCSYEEIRNFSDNYFTEEFEALFKIDNFAYEHFVLFFDKQKIVFENKKLLIVIDDAKQSLKLISPNSDDALNQTNKVIDNLYRCLKINHYLDKFNEISPLVEKKLGKKVLKQLKGKKLANDILANTDFHYEKITWATKLFKSERMIPSPRPKTKAEYPRPIQPPTNDSTCKNHISWNPLKSDFLEGWRSDDLRKLNSSNEITNIILSKLPKM